MKQEHGGRSIVYLVFRLMAVLNRLLELGTEMHAFIFCENIFRIFADPNGRAV